MLNNLGNNGEALKIFRTESLLIELPNIYNPNIFNLGAYIASVQQNFDGKQVTKVHLKAVKETLLLTDKQAVGIYSLDGLNIIGGESMLPPVPVLKKNRIFIINNNEEIEFYGNTNFNGVSIIPIGTGADVYTDGYLLQPPTSPVLNPAINDFRLQITLMGL